MQETFPGKENPRLRSGEVSAGDLAEAVLEFYIEGEDDLIGLLAYALYERQKRDFIVSHRKRNAGRSPNDAEIAAVTSNYLSADLRNTLRDRASQILSSYAEIYVEAMEPQIQLVATNSEALRQVRGIEKSVKKPMFTSLVVPNGTLAPRFTFGCTPGCITVSATGGSSGSSASPSL